MRSRTSAVEMKNKISEMVYVSIIFFIFTFKFIVCVHHEWRHFQDWISQIYSNQHKFDCVWLSIKFHAFWWFTSFKPVVKFVIKLKNCLKYDVIFNTHAFFSFLNEKFIFVLISAKFINIDEDALYRRKCQYRQMFLPKNFQRYWAPLHSKKRNF